jgi:hypothetical protein
MNMFVRRKLALLNLISSLLDPADSNNGLSDPENDGGRKNPKTTLENDVGVVFENTRGRLGQVVSRKRPRESFQNDFLAS